jgi:hypothetical protein
MDLQDYTAQDLDRLRDQQPACGRRATASTASSSSRCVAGGRRAPGPGLPGLLQQRMQALGLAQDQANKDQRWADLANTGVKVSASLDGKDPDKALLDANNARAQRPVAQVLQRSAAEDAATKDFAGQQEIAARATALSFDQQKRDPDSPVSRRFQAFYAPILGPLAKNLTAADAEMAQQGGTLQLEKLRAIAQQKQAQAELQRQAARDAETARHNRVDEGNAAARTAAEQTRFAAELGQKGRVPEQEAAKIVNMGQALHAIDLLQEQYHKAGLGAPNENSRYELMKNALIPIVVAGAAPSARESAPLMEQYKHDMPGTYTRDANGDVFFESIRNAVRANSKSQTAALGAGNYSPQQVAELQRQSDEIAAGGRASGGATRVNLFDPSGKPINLPSGQVDAYLAANPGAKRAGP